MPADTAAHHADEWTRNLPVSFAEQRDAFVREKHIFHRDTSAPASRRKMFRRRCASDRASPPYMFGTSMSNSCAFSSSAIVKSGSRASVSVSELRERNAGISHAAVATSFLSEAAKTWLFAVSTRAVINTTRTLSWAKPTN